MQKLWKRIVHAAQYGKVLCKWLLIGLMVGLIGGVVGTMFHLGVEWVTELRLNNDWILWLLPACGVLITALYHVCKLEGTDTNNIIESVHFGEKVPLLLVPLIYIATMLTHLCGGSAGREGAALQIGGGIGHRVGRVLHLGEKEMPLATLSGMAALFSALFGTPLAAVMFAMEVISVGVLYYAALVPCMTASFVGYLVSTRLGTTPVRFLLRMPQVEVWPMVQVGILAIGCAVVSIIFCQGLHSIEHLAEKFLKNAYVRAAVGGGLIIALTFLAGTDYNGTGMDVIARAIGEEHIFWAAWLLKILFTAITIGCGFKGGEVVPSFFVGATFGAVAAPLIGLPGGFGAAIGMVAVFCGAVNCPVASCILGVEIFGASGMMYFAMACAISYLLSGYRGLYSSQTIMYSKLRAEYINVHTK